MENFTTTLRSNWKTIVAMIVLLGGLVLTLVLMQNRQIFRSKAATDINTVLNIADENGNTLEYQGNNTYQAPESKKIRINIKDIEELR